MRFAMFDASGAPVSSFGLERDGQLSVNQLHSSIYDAELTPDGELVFVGRSGTTASPALIGRITEQGALETTLNGFGERLIGANVFIPNAQAEVHIEKAAVQPDRKIVAVGVAAVVTNGNLNACMAIVRINETGEFDTTFSGGGHLCFQPPGTTTPVAYATDVALQSDGRIVISAFAYREGGSGRDFAVKRLTPQGALDILFGPNHDGWAFAAFDMSGSANDDAYIWCSTPQAGSL